MNLLLTAAGTSGSPTAEGTYCAELNRLLGGEVIQRVEFVLRGSVIDAIRRIDRDQSFAHLYAQARGVVYPGWMVDDRSPAGVMEAMRAASDLQKQLDFPDSMIAYMRGVEYWRAVQAECGDSSIRDMVLRKRVGDCLSDDEVGLMSTMERASYRIPLGLLSEEPGTCLVYCTN